MPLSPLRRSWATVPLRSRVTGVAAQTLRHWLADLPPPPGYGVSARPLRYRQAPHLAAFCWYEDRLIELQVPEPFRAWEERVYYRARRKPGRRLAFQWFSRRVRFRTGARCCALSIATSSITGTCARCAAARPRRKPPATASPWPTFAPAMPASTGLPCSRGTIQPAGR